MPWGGHQTAKPGKPVEPRAWKATGGGSLLGPGKSYLCLFHGTVTPVGGHVRDSGRDGTAWYRPQPEADGGLLGPEPLTQTVQMSRFLDSISLEYFASSLLEVMEVCVFGIPLFFGIHVIISLAG